MRNPRSGRVCVWVTSVVATLLLAGTMFPQTSTATSVRQLSDAELVRSSSSIIEGQVTGVRSEWNAGRTQIYTIVTIRISNSLKGGAAAGEQVVLRLLGGRVGDTVAELVGGPKFAVDEDVIVFLDSGAVDLMPVTGLFQGKFTVATDPNSGARMVSGRPATRDAFVDDIARIVTAQEGGR
jgi:hypothetical protein